MIVLSMIVHNEYHNPTPWGETINYIEITFITMEVRDIIYLIVAVILAVIAFYVLIWLLPVIVILIIAYIIYIFLKSGA